MFHDSRSRTPLITARPSGCVFGNYVKHKYIKKSAENSKTHGKVFISFLGTEKVATLLNERTNKCFHKCMGCLKELQTIQQKIVRFLGVEDKSPAAYFI